MGKKILIVPVGGTICTEKGDESKSIPERFDPGLVDCFYLDSGLKLAKEITFFLCKTDNSFITVDEYKQGTSSDIFFPRILSENMSIAKWNTILNFFRDNLRLFSQFDGIIIEHGTDTLAYSSALFSLLLTEIGLPVMFVSSNDSLFEDRVTSGERIKNKNANGFENFNTAVELIYYGLSSGVYVVYNNLSDKKTYLHLASRLTQCKNFFVADFYSKDAIEIGDINCGVIKEINDRFGKRLIEENRLLSSSKGKPLSADGIMIIEPYVGLDYKNFNLDKVRTIIHNTYHSKTFCSDYRDVASVFTLLDEIEKTKKEIDVYFVTPVEEEGELVYESVSDFNKIIKERNYTYSHCHFANCNTELLFALLVVGNSFGISNNLTESFLIIEKE